MAKPETVAAIKAKFPGANLSKKRLEQIGDKLETKITDDNDVNAAIDAFNDYNPILEIASRDDKMRDLEQKAKAAKQTPSGNSQTDDDDKDKDVPAGDQPPLWAKALIDNNQKLASQLQALQTEKVQSSIQQKAEAALPGMQKSFWNKRALPQKEEDLDAFVSEVKADWDGFVKESTEKGLKVIPPPGGGAGPQSKGVSPAIKALFPAQTAAPAQGQPGGDGSNRYTLNTPGSTGTVGAR